MNPLTQKLFAFSVLGSLASLYLPLILGAWKKHLGQMYAALKIQPAAYNAAGGEPNKKVSPIVQLLLTFFLITLKPFFNRARKVLVLAILSLIIASISSALGFVAFLQHKETQELLDKLGGIAYFAAFNYGFSATSLIEEALRGGINHPAANPNQNKE